MQRVIPTPARGQVGKVFAKRVAEDTQLYQVIDIDDRNCATGELYDAFTLEKRDGESNRLREALPPENRSPMTAP